jgi:hypothetical protein
VARFVHPRIEWNLFLESLLIRIDQIFLYYDFQIFPHVPILFSWMWCGCVRKVRIGVIMGDTEGIRGMGRRGRVYWWFNRDYLFGLVKQIIPDITNPSRARCLWGWWDIKSKRNAG